LKDGSNITLNTASAVRVDLTPAERHVDLERGEAFFVVAKDPSRPFVVKAGNKRIVAVGTQFSVRRDGDDVRVVVTEGTVRLETVSRNRLREPAPGIQPGPSISDFAPVAAAMIARATGGDLLVQNSSMAEVEAALSWRNGYLTFHETTLTEAVEEFNRYNTQKISIEDPLVGAIRISGTFRPTNHEAFVRLLQEAYGIRAQSRDGGVALANE
jgi:transmembrane sensor